jgi:hypothetical protein
VEEKKMNYEPTQEDWDSYKLWETNMIQHIMSTEEQKYEQLWENAGEE